MGHGTAIDPGTGPEQCGSIGAFVVDVDLCAALHHFRFFGLVEGGAPHEGEGEGEGDGPAAEGEGEGEAEGEGATPAPGAGFGACGCTSARCSGADAWALAAVVVALGLLPHWNRRRRSG
jgi:hypothetical protein